MADFIKELVKKIAFLYLFITYFAFYLNDCIIEPFIVNRFNRVSRGGPLLTLLLILKNCCCCYCADFSRFIALDINNYYYN